MLEGIDLVDHRLPGADAAVVRLDAVHLAALARPLERLREVIAQLNRLQTAPVMIEYLMLAGVNDSPEDAAELYAWLSGLNVHVNLIPYNPIDGAPHLKGTDRTGRDAFAGLLKQAGLKCTIRYSLGGDIAAACGQLVRQENRAQRLAQVQAPTFPS